ncbi:unnamed protein product [Danaus chrysippus]|uniref:(African queen) hypothetical protein n=1 Tax=Danaus chrysippus TaxID=151541 RepID=A0A8J2W3S8_9NEOP|nr:unnamed protein product [Danaus chrysippus]
MQNKLFFVFSLTFLYWVKSSPVDRGSLAFDSLDTDISDLKYEGGLEDFFKTDDETKSKPKTKINASGFRKKKSKNLGVKIDYDIEDLKKFLKEAGLKDVGSYDDGAIYALAEGITAKGLGVTGNEEKKYKKGFKTKGCHRISHKDEYQKDKEFYNEDETSGVIKKVGAKGFGFKSGIGAEIGKGYFKHNRAKGLYGKTGFSDVGNLNKDYEGYADSDGIEEYFDVEKQ